MKKKTSAIFLLFLWMFLFTPIASAMETDVDTSVKVYDYAGLLTDEETSELSDEAVQLGESYGIDVVVVTIDDDEDMSSMEYADDFYDYNGFSANGILMLINMDYREVWFSTCGSCIQIFHDQRIESLVQSSLSKLADGDYSAAVRTFFQRAEGFLTQGAEPDSPIYEVEDPEELDYTPETALQKTAKRIPLYLLIAAAVSGISIAVMVSSNKSARTAREASRYLESNSVQVTLRNDQFLRSTVTKVRIDHDSSSGGGRSGGSSVHTGSSGRSHGGGGGRF